MAIKKKWRIRVKCQTEINEGPGSGEGWHYWTEEQWDPANESTVCGDHPESAVSDFTYAKHWMEDDGT